MRDNIIFEKFGRKQYEKGLKDGREEAREEAREKGIEKIAIKLLKNKDLSLEYISDVTGLSKDKIKTLNASK